MGARGVEQLAQPGTPRAVGRPRSPAHARFLVIGAGGLGCPALLGLVEGGARCLSVVDDDQVDLSNLPRQVLYGTGDLGLAKVDAAGYALRARCPEREPLELRTIRQRLPADDDEALDALLARERPEVVLECSDSPRLKFALHDACVRGGVKLVVGGVVRWGGQAMAVDPTLTDRACYRCLFEAPPPPELSPACASVGVFGPAAGALGHVMAQLALALLDPARSPAGQFTHFDLQNFQVRQLRPKPRRDCISCGRNIEFGAT